MRRDQERLRELAEEGELERVRVTQAWERTQGHAAETARLSASVARKSVMGLKWAGVALASAGVVWRLTRARRGFRLARWFWRLSPVVGRVAVSHFFRKRDPQKRK